MNYIILFKRRALNALFLLSFLSSCSQNCPEPEWNLDETYFSCPNTYVNRSIYPATSDYNGIEIEILSDSTNSWVYLNLKGGSLKKEEDPIVVGTANGEEIRGYIMEGGERIVLEETSSDLFIDAVNNKYSISLSFYQYSACL